MVEIDVETNTQSNRTRSSVNSLLNVRVDCDHALVQIREILHQHLCIKGHGDEKGGHTTLDRDEEDVGNLETDEEGKCHDDSGKGVARVVLRLGEGDVEVGEERAEVGNGNGTHGEDGVDEAFVDECVDTSVLHKLPGFLRLR